MTIVGCSIQWPKELHFESEEDQSAKYVSLFASWAEFSY
jgi:hypothetical protein